MADRLSSGRSGLSTPAVFADDGSVVSARELTNVKAKSFNINIETVWDAGSPPDGNVAQQANYTASGGSVIFADKIDGGTFDGDFNFTVKTTQRCAGTVAEMLPTPQGPAVKMITDHKVELIEYLMADPSFILQHVQAKRIVTDREYMNIKSNPQPEKTVTDLIDKVISKGQESCSGFLEVLKESDVLSTYPQLRNILTK